ncbi:MAG: thermonuclease family protein [Lachnospiraceae bacterium]|nr:thermonuclease family protein [Lachnospiraceae bacterium]
MKVIKNILITFLIANLVIVAGTGVYSHFCGDAKRAEAKSFKVSSVTDGDTFKIKKNGKIITVRLIGVDTPESVATRSDLVNTDWGKKASKFTKKILSGKKVTLKYDKSKKDIYGRTLAYVYYKKSGKTIFLNNQLVKKGYARAVYYAPNKKYKAKFEKSQKYAKKHKIGFWKDGFSNAFPSKTE